MNELIEKVDNLKKSLDSSDMVLSLKEVEDRVKKDSTLIGLLEEYQIYPREDLKEMILSSPLFQEFKIKETDLNLFIMDMNQRLKKISSKGECHHESH